MRREDHYVALDGMRGLAAISVLFLHLGYWQQQPILAGNAGLAVDFFFTLSGYVLACAYGSKLEASMSPWKFFVLRLIRLMPLIVLGTLISGAYLVARIYWLNDTDILLEDVFVASVLGVLCVPMFSAAIPIGGPHVFPLNPPQYTLFLELLINCLWAAVRPSRRFGLALVLTVTGYSLSAAYGMGGDTVQTFWTGFPRVLGAYYAGTLIFYAQNKSSVFSDMRWGRCFWPLLFMTFILFWWPDTLTHWMRWGWSLVFAPLLVLTGSRVQLKGSKRRIALLLGELSYPIYALHYPIFVWVNAAYQTVLQRKDFSIGSMLVLPLVLVGAWLALKWVDLPVRVSVTARIFGRRVRRSAT